MTRPEPRSRKGRAATATLWLLAALVLVLARGSAGAVRPRYGETARRGFVGELRTVHPRRAAAVAEREVAAQIHAGLYRLDEDGEPVPNLVDRVEIIAGGARVRLGLRPAWFHDGRPVTAEDVRASLDRYTSSGGPGALLAGDPTSAPPAEPLVQVSGSREVVVRVSAAPVAWPWLLADPRAAILPADAQDGPGRVGAGPFTLAAHDPAAASAMLAPNRTFHRGRPYLDGLEYRAWPDERALLAAHRHRGVDVIDQTELEEGTGLAIGENVTLRVVPGRRALAGSLERAAALGAIRLDALVDVVLGGKVERARGLLRLHPTLEEPRVAPFAEPPPPGTRAATLTLAYPAAAGMQLVVDRLRVDLHAAGFRVEPRPLGAAELLQVLEGGEADLGLLVLPAGNLPPLLELAESARLLALAPPAALFQTALGEGPRTSPARDLLAAEAALLEDARVLYHRKRAFLVRSALRDVRVSPAGVALFEDAWRWPRP